MNLVYRLLPLVLLAHLSPWLHAQIAVTPISGTPQSTLFGTPFGNALRVMVTDGGNPISGIAVTFTPPSPSAASAMLSSTTAVTDATGIASVTATANFTTGKYNVTATSLGASAVFALTNLSTPPSVITASPTVPESALLGTGFARPLQVTITDGNGIAASGIVVTFAGPATGASAVLSSNAAITNDSGVASVSATAGSLAGSYTVTATAGALSAAFAMTNEQSTTVTLFSPSNPTTFGAPLTLTAVVNGSSPSGRVAFFDGFSLLGTKTTSASLVTLTTILLAPGSHKLAAVYRDDVHSVIGTSNIVTEVVQATALASLAAQSALNLPATSYVAVGDFNGDGKADIVSVSGTSGSGVLTVLLGKGDGTFQQPLTSPVPSVGQLTLGDFNDDGYTDLAVTSFNTTVLLGNGDGTFHVGNTFAVGNLPSSSVLTDFNNDGNADLVSSGSQANGMLFSSAQALLAGNGDGTFAVTTSNLFFGPPLVAADVNGDGKVDLVGANFLSPGGPAGVLGTVLVGNGDGTFQKPASINLGGQASSLLAADFNGDGKIDLAAGLTSIGGTNSFAATRVLLGNGDGTFQAPMSFSIGQAMLTGDFNGDGIIDLVAADTSGNTVILLGNGDGSFRSGPTVGVGSPVAVADFNGDGRPDIVLTNPATGAVNIALGAGSSMITITATGGTAQSAGTGSPFGLPLQVTVRNSGAPLGGAAVTFSAPTSGASATLSASSAVTNASGVAGVTATANAIAGNYVVTATYQGQTASFSLSNTTFAFITATGGTPQSATLGAMFASLLQATVKDSFGNPVSGVTVTWSAPASGASSILSGTSSVTNANGVASITAVANQIAGAYVVTAGVGTPTASFFLTNTPSGNTDLALGKTATQSSNLPGYTTVGANLAVDGNTDGNFFDGSVTHTNPDPNAWWQVDLGSSATVNSIVIWNRTDCCGNRLSDYWVFVSNMPFQATDTPATLATRAGTFASHQTTMPNPSATINAGGFQGQYVRVQLSGTNNLSLAEVQVLGTPGGSSSTNVALGKQATQSSNLPGYTTVGANLAVDGNTDGNFFDGSVTHTNLDANAWWQVDLGGAATVNSIVVWNRTDCCGNRLSDYWVFVSNTPFLATDTPATLATRASTFASHQTTSPAPSTSISVGGFQGRYVRVQLSGTNNLSLAEVQVLGTGGSTTTNVALGKITAQSSNLPGYTTVGSALAVDGNTDGNFFDGSVTHTNPDANAWWQVDLGASASISSIVISNRTDCCSDRLSDYWVFVSDTPFQATDTPTTLSTRAGTFSSHQTTAPGPQGTITIPGAQGRYVRVQLSGTNYLSLAEVQVFGQ